MHELAVAQALVRQIRSLAGERPGMTVREIMIDIGPLSGVEPDLLQQAFPLASVGSPADGARLTVQRPPVEVRCHDCGHAGPAAVNRLLCAACGGWRVAVTQGEDLLLRSVVFDRPAPSPPEPGKRPHGASDHV